MCVKEVPQRRRYEELQRKLIEERRLVDRLRRENGLLRKQARLTSLSKLEAELIAACERFVNIWVYDSMPQGKLANARLNLINAFVDYEQARSGCAAADKLTRGANKFIERELKRLSELDPNAEVTHYG